MITASYWSSYEPSLLLVELYRASYRFSSTSHSGSVFPRGRVRIDRPGTSCKFVPDLALMSFILFFGTYSMTVSLKKFKFSRYFPTKLRKLISDFSIFMSIMTFVGLDMLMGLKTPKLIVPTELRVGSPHPQGSSSALSTTGGERLQK
ncbi:unnamed protein product [Boreogadus saida]